MTILLSSDAHFWHKNAKYHCPGRPGKDIEEMNEILIQNWNSVVKEKDDIYFLGDFALTSQQKLLEPILERLNGRKYLIRGNHDKKTSKKEWFQKHWIWIKDYYELKVQDSDSLNGKSQLIILSHYPFLTWNHAQHGSFMLHGHSHNSISYLNKNTTRLDVGMDNPICNYKPISYEQIKKILTTKIYQPVDHHRTHKNS